MPRSRPERKGGPLLAAGSLVLVDSSALIYLVEGESSAPRRLAAERFLAEAARREVRMAVSAVAWAELLEGPLARGDRGLADAYRRLLAEGDRFLVRELDVAVAEEAARLAASMPAPRRRGLSSNDLAQVATAVVLGAAAVFTNDEAWGSVPRCPPLLLVDELAAGQDPWV